MTHVPHTNPDSPSAVSAVQPATATTDKQKLTMRISYERAGQCFWHLQCKAQRHAPPMKIERDDKDGKRTLMRCTACDRAGWYPYGSVGEVCCEELAPPAPTPAVPVEAKQEPANMDDLPHQDSCRWWRHGDLCDCGAASPTAGTPEADYRKANPLGGPAATFDAIANAIRAGDSVDAAMRAFGVRWEAAGTPAPAVPTDSQAATRAEVLSDVDPVVLECWKLQGRKVGAMLRDAQATVIELQEQLEEAKESAAPAVPAPLAELTDDKCWRMLNAAHDIADEAWAGMLLVGPAGELAFKNAEDCKASGTLLPVGWKWFDCYAKGSVEVSQCRVEDAFRSAIEREVRSTSPSVQVPSAGTPGAPPEHYQQLFGNSEWHLMVAPQATVEDGPWKSGNEFLPYHPSASHVRPDYRDGWNACWRSLMSASQGKEQ